jgi:hypothetical protein
MQCNDFSKLKIGLFYSVHTFHLARDSTSTPDRSESLLFRPSSSSSLRSSRRSSKATGVERSTLSNYIRMFEPMVIRALKVSFLLIYFKALAIRYALI